MMQNSNKLIQYTVSIILLLTGCEIAGNSDKYIELTEKDCQPYETAKLKPALDNYWKPYLSATRICSLVKKTGDVPEIMLISVFYADYYLDRAADTTWESFPKPILIHKDGHCVARLPDGFPTAPPRDYELKYGKWLGNIPTEIKIHVINPAVDGDYDLPVLQWEKTKKHYIATGESVGGKRERMGCEP